MTLPYFNVFILYNDFCIKDELSNECEFKMTLHNQINIIK